MKRLVLSLVFLYGASFVFGQDTTKQLTEAEKADLRKNHQSGLTFEKKKTSSSQQLNTSNTTEEDKEDKEITTVKYYYGTEDTTYKEFKYKKP